MRILSDYAIEYSVSQKGNGLLRFFSAMFAGLGIIQIVVAIVYSYYFFIGASLCLGLSIVTEEILKKKEYTVRYEVNEQSFIAKKIGLDGKETTLFDILYRDIEDVSILNTCIKDDNGITFSSGNNCVEIKYGGSSAKCVVDNYMYAALTAYVLKK